MSEKIISFLKSREELVLPYLLAVVLSASCFAVFDVPVLSVYNFASMLICALIFMLCGYAGKNHRKGSLYITLFLLVDIFLLVQMIQGGRGDFIQWFFLAGDNVETISSFYIILLMAFPVFFGFTVYYFTVVIYRMQFLTLASIVPCVIYIKTFEEINNIYLIAAAVLNLLIFIRHSYIKGGKRTRYAGARSGVGALMLYVIVLLVFASAVPKEEEARYYDVFKRIFMSPNTAVRLGVNYSQINDTSGNADNYNDFANRRMYTVWGRNVPYLKRQTFDYYDFENDNWYADEDFSRKAYSKLVWSAGAENLNLERLKNAVKRADELSNGFAQKYGLDRLVYDTYFKDEYNSMYVQANNFSALYYLSTARCVDINVKNIPDACGATLSGAFVAGTAHPSDVMYQVDYYDEIETRKSWISLGGGNFDYETADQMLRELYGILAEDTEVDYRNIYTVAQFWQQQWRANEYRELCEENNSHISDSIRTLAAQITQGCTYDWQKAEALQNYFVLNDFVYDLKYTAEDTSPEYFLFESKTGTCSDFASAYVLLARAAGLTVRYVEGFAPDETPNPEMWFVTDSGSHAYPEVFIQNLGWMVYEPTVASQYNSFDEYEDGGFSFARLKFDKGLFVLVLALAFAAAALALFVFKAVPAIGERLFVKRINKAAPDKCLAMVYNRIAAKKLPYYIGIKTETLTPCELADRTYALIGCDISALALLEEKSVYGGAAVDENDKLMLIELYDRLNAALREYRKNNKR